MRNLIFGLAAIGTAFTTTPAAAGTTIITNEPAWVGTSAGPLGHPDPGLTSFGQSFLSPGGNLRQMTFHLLDSDPFFDPPTEPGNFRLVVSRWDGGALTGPSLYESDPTYYGSPGSFTFDLDVPTIAGDNYIAYLTVVGVADPVAHAFVASTFTSSLPDGGFYYLGVAPEEGVLWYSDWSSSDLIITAAFQAVPEPASWAMLIAGFGMVGLTVRRRSVIAA